MRDGEREKRRECQMKSERENVLMYECVHVGECVLKRGSASE